ncbi:MAG: histidine kinase dimerization/phospho-acceptor domain-containing protein, partial [Geminicoccaceae bacterium]
MSTAAYFAALLLGGMPAALLLIGGCQLVGGFTLCLRRYPSTGAFRRNARSVFFNAGQVTLAAAAAGLVYYLLLPRTVPAHLDTVANLWVVPLAAATMYLVNSFAVAFMVGLQRRLNPLAVWREGRGQDILQFAALYLFGLVIALTATVYPWAPVLLALPVLTIHLSLKRALQLLEERVALANELAATADLRDRYTREHARRVTELTMLHGTGRALAGTLEPGELYAALLGALRTVIPCDAAALYVVDDGGTTRVVATAGSNAAPPASGERQVLIWTVTHSQPRVLNDPQDTPSAVDWPAGVRLLAVPLLATGQARGAVALRRIGGQPFTDSDLRLVESVASQAAVTLHNARLHAQTVSAAAELRAVLESIEPGVLMTDRAGRIRFANRRLGELLPLDPRDLVGRRYEQVVAPQLERWTRDPGVFAARLRWLAAHPEQAVTDEIALMRPIGCILDRFTGPVRDPETGAIVGRLEVYTDVTEERRLERAKDEFLATASHELKTPITTLGGYLELLQHQLARPGGGDPSRLSRYTTTAQRELKRLRQLSDDLLEVARIEAGRLTLHLVPLDLAAVLREMVERFAAHPLLLERGHRVSCRAAEALPSHGDLLRLQQVVGNLLENALKYSPD